jgi:hypothetical protein
LFFCSGSLGINQLFKKGLIFRLSFENVFLENHVLEVVEESSKMHTLILSVNLKHVSFGSGCGQFNLSRIPCHAISALGVFTLKSSGINAQIAFLTFIIST